MFQITTEMCEGSIEVDGEMLYCELPATRRTKGEQDSFGVEWVFLCDTCLDEWLDMLGEQREKDKIGHCEWCKQPSTDRYDYKGWEDQPWETALVCGVCRGKDWDSLQEELHGPEVVYEDCDCCGRTAEQIKVLDKCLCETGGCEACNEAAEAFDVEEELVF